MKSKQLSSHRSQTSLRLELQLLKCALRMERLTNARFRGAHNSSLARFDVLACLHQAEGGPMSTTMLAGQLIASKGNITRLLDRMADDNLIKRHANQDDRRVSDVMLTDLGKQRFEQMAADHALWMDAVFQDLAEDEATMLSKLLGRVRDGIDRELQSSE